MAQVKITNHTACEHQVLFANDENFRPIVCPIIKATFDIANDGTLKFAKKQVPVNLEGEYSADPESSSYIYEPECAFIKPTTDVVVIGDAISTFGPLTHLLVEIQVGSLYQKIGVIGDREWVKQAVGYAISEPQPFERMPLVYENAFGGWDKRAGDASKQGFEPRNTVGKGFYVDTGEPVTEPMYLPNLENPDQLIQKISDRPEPVSCGFTLPHWQPRVGYAGTYDDAWTNSRSPMLPLDFDRRYFNAANANLTADSYLKGNEPVRLCNLTHVPEFHFQLPGVKSPYVELEFPDGVEQFHTNLDTIIINLHDMQLQMIWRNYFQLENGPHDLDAIDIRYG